MRVTLFDGENAWTLNYDKGSSTKIGGLRLKMIQTLGKISNPAYSYNDIFPNIELRQVYVEGKEYYRLVCSASDAEIPPLTIYVDKNNFLTRKVSVDFVNEGGNTINYVSVINEYVLLSGVLMPAVITADVNGEKSRYRTIEFKLDIQFPPNEFVLPVPWYLQPGAAGENRIGAGKNRQAEMTI